MVLRDHGKQAVARLGQRGERLQRFEGHRQAAAVALVLVALAGRARADSRLSACACLGGARPRVWLLLGSCCRHACVAHSRGAPTRGQGSVASYRQQRANG